MKNRNKKMILAVFFDRYSNYEWVCRDERKRF